MPRIQEIDRQLSALPQSGKRIVYWITEDRDILEEVFAGAAPTLKALADGAFDGCYAPDGLLYAYACRNNILADLYALDAVGGKLSTQFLPRSKPDPLQPDPLGRAAFLYVGDFHIMQADSAAHLLKQFLHYAHTQAENGRQVYLFLISPVLCLPDGFAHEVEIIDVPEMDKEDIALLLLRQAAQERPDGQLQPDGETDSGLHGVDRQRILQAAADFKGLARRDILSIVNDLRSECGSFYGQSDRPNGTTENLERIRQARVRLVADCKAAAARHDKTVTMLQPDWAVSGLDGYMNWLGEVKDDLLAPEEALAWGYLPPKGVLMSGVPGSGKTQAAKRTAAELGVSLVQFRMDNLLGGLVGDSENNFKRCRKRIEALAPCVVLIDEMEKLFGDADGAGSHEVKMNLLAALLDWLQENQKPIFFFATCNSVRGLRPELLRDGRLDMRFYVFMPTRDELAGIFSFHLARANRWSGGRLFARFAGEFTELAQDFLEEIALYGEQTGKAMLYTGANVENLVAQTNRTLRRSLSTSDGLTRTQYLDALLQTAKSSRSQPYGVTNLEDIADFWLGARKNQYANAGGRELLPFDGLDTGETVRFRTPAPQGNRYDKLLFQRVSQEICRLYTARKQAGRPV